MFVNGKVLLSRHAFVRERGDEAFGKWLGRLSAETRDVMEAGPSGAKWYPFMTLVEASDAIDEEFGKGDLAMWEDLGRFACERMLPGPLKLFFRLGNLNFLVDRASKAYGLNYDEGIMEVRIRSQGHTAIELLDFPAPHYGHCLAIKGWMMRAAELTGAQVIDYIHECKAHGGERCYWEFRWR